MIRECPQCKCEILYKKKRSYESAEVNRTLCRKCNWTKTARDPERNRKVSEARKKWWEEKRKNQEEYSAICEKLGRNNSAIWSDESKREAWMSSRWSEDKKAEMSEKVREKWENTGKEELAETKRRMVSARIENGTIGRNNRKKRGSFGGIDYESSTEERFLRSHLLNLGLRRANAISSGVHAYKPDFWSDHMQCYIEVKSTWTFDVMRGLKSYNSRSEQDHTQLEKIVSLCSENNIKLCVEVGRSFYIHDPVSVTKLTNVVEDGKLLGLGLDNNIKL